MARVNIEERGVVMAKRLARMCGWTKQHAIGVLYCLWHDSQEIEATHCTAEDLIDWLDLVQAPAQADAQAVAQALVECGYLEPSGGNRYRIRGNEKHIESLRQKREAAAEGGRKSAEIRAAKAQSFQKPTETQAAAQAPAQADAQPPAQAGAQADGQARDEPSAVLCSALLCSAENTNTPPPPKIDSGGSGNASRHLGGAVTAELLKECSAIWSETLRGFNIERGVLAEEELIIARALQASGPEAVKIALFGALFEPANEKWNPRDHVDITRVLLKDDKGKPRIQKFVNYGVKERKRRQDEMKKKADEAAQLERDKNSDLSQVAISKTLGQFSRFAKGSAPSQVDFHSLVPEAP